MGIDGQLVARVPTIDDDWSDFTEWANSFLDAFEVEGVLLDGGMWPRLDIQGRYVEVLTFQRWYSPTYRRGHWPTIRAYGDWLMEHLPVGTDVRYFSDDGDFDAAESWPETRCQNDVDWGSRLREELSP